MNLTNIVRRHGKKATGAAALAAVAGYLGYKVLDDLYECPKKIIGLERDLSAQQKEIDAIRRFIWRDRGSNYFERVSTGGHL